MKEGEGGNVAVDREDFGAEVGGEVKEKWDEVNRLRKRRVRWTIGGDKIDVDYEVGTNTAALPTVNALFQTIVSTHSHLATIDIVDYYLGAILSSPESVRLDVSSIFLPTLTQLGLLSFLRHSHGKPFIFCDVLKTVPGLPQSGLLSQLRLIVCLLTQHNTTQHNTTQHNTTQRKTTQHKTTQNKTPHPQI